MTLPQGRAMTREQSEEIREFLGIYDIPDTAPLYLYKGEDALGVTEYTLFYRDANHHKRRRDYDVIDGTPVQIGPDHDATKASENATRWLKGNNV